jgi:large subunit ribosomal protein L4
VKVKTYNQAGQPGAEIDVATQHDLKHTSPQIVHDAVVAYRANRRLGTACTKTIAEVAGSGKKPWRQKGTGRARSGLVRSPIWRKGGVVFGPKPRDYSKRMPSRVKKLAFEQAFAGRIQGGDVIVVEGLDVVKEESKHLTKQLVTFLKNLPLNGYTLLVHENPSVVLRRASRNMENVGLVSAESLNTYEVLDCDKVVITKTALQKLSSRGIALGRAA